MAGYYTAMEGRRPKRALRDAALSDEIERVSATARWTRGLVGARTMWHLLRQRAGPGAPRAVDARGRSAGCSRRFRRFVTTQSNAAAGTLAQRQFGYSAPATTRPWRTSGTGYVRLSPVAMAPPIGRAPIEHGRFPSDDGARKLIWVTQYKMDRRSATGVVVRADGLDQRAVEVEVGDQDDRLALRRAGDRVALDVADDAAADPVDAALGADPVADDGEDAVDGGEGLGLDHLGGALAGRDATSPASSTGR